MTPFTSSHDRWYTLADIFAAKLLEGDTEPEIEEAIEFFETERQTELKRMIYVKPVLPPFIGCECLG